MAWITKEEKRQTRGNDVVGARLVFDNGEPETVSVPNPAFGMVPDPAVNPPQVVVGQEQFQDGTRQILRGQDENGQDVFDTVIVQNVRDVMGPDPDFDHPIISNGEPESIEAPNPDYEFEEKVWGRDPEQNLGQFIQMVQGERDAWLGHFDVHNVPGRGRGRAFVESDL